MQGKSMITHSSDCVLMVALALVLCVQGQYASTGKGCGIPVIVNTVPVPVPAQVAGVWYKHRQSGAVTTNQIFRHTVLNRTAMPFSTTPAIGTVIEMGQYNNPDTTNCVYRYYLGVCGVNGQCHGKGLSSVDGYIPITNDFNILYLDIEIFYLAYVCARPNYKSGMCDVPSFHVICRKRPDQMSANEIKAMDDIVDGVLAPYCYSSADMAQQVYTNDKSFCTQTDYPECVAKLVTGLKNEISNSVSN